MITSWIGAMALSMSLVAPVAAGADAPGNGGPVYRGAYANITGTLLLENERVVAEKFIVRPGESTGRHTHRSDQLVVFIKGGVLTENATGRATLWRDGRVLWREATRQPDEGSTNTGASPVEFDLVTLKPVPLHAAAGTQPKFRYLNYPNIPGEDLLENDSVIVQRFLVNPGQWEGVHAHHPDMLYIHVRGGRWAARSKTEPERVYPEDSPDASVGWMRLVDISEGH